MSFGVGGGGSPSETDFVPLVPPKPKKSGGGGGLFGAIGRGIGAVAHAPTGLLRQSAELTESAFRGLPSLGFGAVKEIGHNVGSEIEGLRHRPFETIGGNLSLQTPATQQTLRDLTMGSGGWDERVARTSKDSPILAGGIGSIARTGQDVEQLGRAGVNRLLPGVPAGAGVGQLGSGPGGLGKTAFAKSVKKGGGGALPKVVEDVANASLFTGPASELVSGAAAKAAGEASERAAALSEAQAAAKTAQSAVEKSINEASTQALKAAQEAQAARTAAAAGDVNAAAQVADADQRAAAASESLRQLREYAQQQATEHEGRIGPLQQYADEAAQRAEQLKGHAQTAKLIKHAGLQAANSPFAPLTGLTLTEGGTHVPGALGLAGKLAEKITGSELGQRYIQPQIAKVQTALEHTSQKHGVDRMIEELVQAKLTEDAQLQRETERATSPTLLRSEAKNRIGRLKQIVERDPDAEKVVIMAKTGEGYQLGDLMRNPELAPGEAEAIFRQANPNFAPDHPSPYTDETLKLAAEVFGPGEATGRAQELRDMLPETHARYRAGLEQSQAATYGEMRGSREPILARGGLGPGVYEHAQHNIEGEGPRIEGLKQYAKITREHEVRKGRQEALVERAGKKLVKSVERLDKTGLSEAERKNPQLLMERVYVPAEDTARRAIGAGVDLTQATEPRLARIGKRLADGKISQDQAITDLASEIVRVARREPSALSPVARELVDEARTRGIGELPRRVLPDVAGAAAPAMQAGAGAERARIGGTLIEQGTKRIEQGQTLYGRAMEKLGGDTRANLGPVTRAQERLTDAAQHLADLREKLVVARERTGAAEGTDLFEHAGVDRREVGQTVRDIRVQVQQEFKRQAKLLEDELERKDIKRLRWPPTEERHEWSSSAGRFVKRRVEAAGFSGEDVQALRESGLTHDSRFFGPDGKSPEELVNTWHGAEGVGGQNLSAVEEAAHTVENWLETVRTVKQLEEMSRQGIERGWDPRKFAAARAEIRQLLTNEWGPELADQLAERVTYGHPDAIAGDILERVGKEARSQLGLKDPAERVAAGGDVAQALENDRQLAQDRYPARAATPGRNSLDTQGKALYDQLVAEGKQGVQEQVVGQREAQLGRTFEQQAGRAREQGQSEGVLLGRAREQMTRGEQLAGQGEKLQESGAKITEQTPELARQSAERAAAPLARLYTDVGEKQGAVQRAAAEYAKETRALERLDERLAAKLDKLRQSVEAAPRRYRPFLEMGHRIRKNLIDVADRLDAEMPGAGDTYRAAAAEVLVNLDDIQRMGFDPQYVVGLKEAGNLYPPKGAGEMKARQGQRVLPQAHDPGFRKPGTGLKHVTDFEQLRRKAGRVIDDVVSTEAAQKIRDAFGGTLRDELAKVGVNADALNQEQLVKAMHDNHLSPWNAADRLGKLLKGSQVDADTVVIPRHIWKTYASYTNEVFKGGNVLAAYDRAMRTWKSGVLALTGRWHVGNVVGNALMAMAGGGLTPGEYLKNMHRARRILKMGADLTAEDIAYLDKLPPSVRQALDEHAYAPAGLIRRGFMAGEGFLDDVTGNESFLRHPIKRSYAFNGFVDDMTRTAIFMAKTERGFDAAALADFRRAYPEMAHLTDEQITREAAVRLALRTAGDFTNLTSFEQGVVKRIIPFYPWLRHITKLTANMVIHDPLRTAWLLHLPSMFDPGDPPAGWLGESFNLGDNRWLSLPGINPFSSVGQATNPQEVFGSVSPLAGIAAAEGGYDLRKLRPLKRPPGQSGLLTPRQLGNVVLNQNPQLQAAASALPALRGHEPIVRYSTGEPILSKGRFIGANDQEFVGTRTGVPSPVAPLVGLAGFPRQRIIDAEQVAAIAQKQAEEAAKQRASYEKKRRAARHRKYAR